MVFKNMTQDGPFTMPISEQQRPGNKYTLMSDIQQSDVEWLWKPYVPSGELTVLDADPGTNKSTITLDLAARVSRGWAMPTDKSKTRRGGVLLLAAEDSLTKTVKPRLQAAGADMCRIAFLDESLTIPSDLAVIVETARRIRAKLLIIDPLMAFLGRDANSDQKVRQALMPLRRFAEQTKMAVVIIRHLNKGGSRNSLYRGSGSIGIIGTTRSALLVGKHPKDQNLRVMCHTKCNLAPEGPSLVFEPVSGEGEVIRIEWRGEGEDTGQDLLASTNGHEDKLENAKRFLLETLAIAPLEQHKIKVLTAEAQMAWRTVERAKEVLGVISQRKGWGPGSKCLWELPKSDAEPIA